ncbi:hypothetical protein D9758_002344 [Tetrapyrgos nigripes]|uniref:Peroxisomal membrane protein 4 n=1 Tax=Tetrapyrgos nigripes TaxID=182062 RepID=A0A8H5GNW1_9AGAR|nr:hypothetical protein D9758_002344 [Tetrapyrgos nigripes]
MIPPMNDVQNDLLPVQDSGAEMTDFLTQAFNELETESSTAVTESNFDYLMSDALIESPTLENQHKAPSVLLPPTPPTWTGPLFINDSERLCQITLSASASDFETEPSGFMAELQYMNSLYLALYELPLIRDSVVQAMVPPAELLTVDGEASCLEKLTIFMAKNDLVALAPTDVQGYGLIDADAEDIASSIVMLLPSTSLQKLFPALNLSDRRLETDLTAVYLEWSIQTDPPLRHSQLNHSLGRIITSLRSPSTQYLPLTEATLSLSILQVSPLIHRFFSLSSHIPYFIWESIDPRTDFTLRVETSLLVDVLRRSHINSTQTPPEQGPVLVFIHASHISTISRLPGLVERRKQLETTFFIYGPPSISETSSLRYIFPAGGVLTFTASCLLAKPYELLKKVKEVAAHPLWCTYIIPPVLGLAMKLFYGEKNPLDEYDKGNFIFDPFLEAIEQDLALVHTPPQADAGNWISEQLESLLRDRRDTLEYCLSEVEADPRYSMISGASHRVLEDDMFDDISRLHIQPRIMSDYRRFVVLVDAKDLKHLDRFKHAGDYRYQCILHSKLLAGMKSCGGLGVGRTHRIYSGACVPACDIDADAFIRFKLASSSLTTTTAMSALERIINDPAYHDYLAILKGARNGFVYGVKVRFPHAVVMSILFGRGDWKSRLNVIYRATRQHAFNLAKFVSLYKTVLLLQKKLNGGKQRSLDTFIAGLLGGYVVFGERTAVNEQIVLYVVARVVASFIPRATSPYNATPSSPRSSAPVKPLPPDSRYFTMLAALSWGAVMYLFNDRGQTIQPGMFNSMTYLYRDSEVWKDLRTLFWHNT